MESDYTGIQGLLPPIRAKWTILGYLALLLTPPRQISVLQQNWITSCSYYGASMLLSLPYESAPVTQTPPQAIFCNGPNTPGFPLFSF